MTRASTPTLIPLEQFAKILGINPVHFSGATADPVFPNNASCSAIWPQYDWQAEDLTSREEVAHLMATAEQEVAEVLGYDIGPTWRVADSYAWPRYHRPESHTGYYDLRLHPLAFSLRRGRVISPGRRATTLIDDAVTVTYWDVDGDGWTELAALNVADPGYAYDEIKLFYLGHGAHPAWEIRPIGNVAEAGGILTISAPSWLFIDPDLWERYPTSAPFTAIDLTSASNLVSTVNVYRVYTDTTQESAEFVWPAQTCADPSVQPTQGGVMQIRHADRGIVSAAPAVYGTAWASQQYSYLEDPVAVRFWYCAGYQNTHFPHADDPYDIDLLLAQAVVWMTAARLTKPVCGCGNVQETVHQLQREMLAGGRDGRMTVYDPSYITTNPFGTRIGEVRAWQRIGRLLGDREWRAGAV